MEQQARTLGERLGESVRRGIASQGKAYSEYGDMLDLLAQRKIKATDFGRKSMDIYVGAAADAASIGIAMATDIAQAGIGGFSEIRAEAEAAVDQVSTRRTSKSSAGAKAGD